MSISLPPAVAFTQPSTNVVTISGSELYALTLNLVPRTSTFICFADTTSGISSLRATSKYASPFSSMSRFFTLKSDAYRSELPELSMTFVPSGREIVLFCPLAAMHSKTLASVSVPLPARNPVTNATATQAAAALNFNIFLNVNLFWVLMPVSRLCRILSFCSSGISVSASCHLANANSSNERAASPSSI